MKRTIKRKLRAFLVGVDKRYKIFRNGGYDNRQLAAVALGAVLTLTLMVFAVTGITSTTAANEKEMARWAACDHEYVVDTKIPSCTENGHYHIECGKCGYVNTDAVLECTGHEYSKTTDNETGKDVVYCKKCNKIVQVNE